MIIKIKDIILNEVTFNKFTRNVVKIKKAINPKKKLSPPEKLDPASSNINTSKLDQTEFLYRMINDPREKRKG